MIVKFVDFPESFKQVREPMLKEIDRVLSCGDLILREDVEKFEKNFAQYVGTKYAVGLNSGTDAIFLSLKALGIGEGDEVITSGYTFWATVEAIINTGATPVLADIKDDLLIDPEDIKKKANGRTKAIIPVHIGGNVCDMEAINTIAAQYWLRVIEDSAQALGSCNIDPDSGDFACYSFYPAKVLGGFGDGGAVATDNEILAERIKSLRNHGGKPHPKLVGFNSRLDNLQAAILNIQIKKVDKYIERRGEIAKIYHDNLADLAERGLIVLPESINWQEYNLRVLAHKDGLVNFLTKNDIETIQGDYTFPLEAPENCRIANNQILRLPIWPTLTDKQIKYVVEKIHEYYKEVALHNNI